MFNINRKFINIISFLLILIAGFSLALRAKSHVYQKDISLSVTYFIILFIIIVSLIQLLLSYYLTEKNTSETKVVVQDDTKNETVEKEEEEVVKSDDENIQKINVKEILGNIIPNKMPSLKEYGESLLNNIAKEFNIAQGVLYGKNISEKTFSGVSFYAYFSDKKPDPFKVGETLPGQVAHNMKFLQIDNIPEEYIQVISGLGSSTPKILAFIPIIKENETIGIIEFASFVTFEDKQIEIFKELGNKIATTLYNYVKDTEIKEDDKK